MNESTCSKCGKTIPNYDTRPPYCHCTRVVDPSLDQAAAKSNVVKNDSDVDHKDNKSGGDVMEGARLKEFKPRHWFIQKPIAHNCPYRTNGAVFQEFQPTLVDNQGGEWIKVWSSEDLSKYLGMGVTRWVKLCQAYDDVVLTFDKERDQWHDNRKEMSEAYETVVRERDEFHRKWKAVSFELNDANDQVDQLREQRDTYAKEIASLKSIEMDLMQAVQRLEKLEADRLKASYDHANCDAVKRVKVEINPSYWPTWEAGRAEGFRAAYSQVQALKRELVEAKALNASLQHNPLAKERDQLREQVARLELKIRIMENCD